MRLLFLATLAFLVATCEPATSQNKPENNSQPRVGVYCSRSQPGLSLAEVQWSLGKSGTPNLSELVPQQVLDVTVYKDGFARGLYKTVKPGTEQREFVRFKTQEQQETKETPGLQNLKLAQFATSQEKPQEGLRLMMRPMEGQESAVAKMQGLEPGMRYFVRISSPGAEAKTVAFTASVCPVDHVEPERK